MRVGLALVGLIGATACIQKPPQATVRLMPGAATTGQAVLVMPTACVGKELGPGCSPRAMVGSGESQALASVSFAALVDPVLHLKLEFAGFTLAEAVSLRISTAESRPKSDEVRVEETVAGLPAAEVLLVAQSLGLSGVVTSTLDMWSSGFGEVTGRLVVTLTDVETNRPRWTVTCSERFYNAVDSPRRLADCAGNGILVAFAPGDLIGKAL